MKLSLAQLVLLLLISIALAVGYGSWYSFIAGESAHVALLSAQIAAKKQTADRASAVQAALGELSTDEAVVESYFISDQDIAALPGKLEALGSSLGTKVQILSIGEEKNAARMAWGVSVSINGSFDAVARTIGAIESAPYDITVVNAVLTSAPEEKKVLWNANVMLSVGRIGATSTPASSTPPPSGPLPSTPNQSAPTPPQKGSSGGPSTL